MDLLRSLPIGLYLEQPLTWLHRLDPRIKLAWLLSFLLAPIYSNVFCRVGVVVVLILVAVLAGIPWRALKQQLGLILLFGGLMFVLGLVLPDSASMPHQPRMPAEPEVISNYKYVLFQFDQGWLHLKITRRSLKTATYVSTLLFTLIYSTTIFLLTTAPEEVTAALEKLMQPLKRFKVPVTEIALTLTLALRFIPLVLEEVQNLVRSMSTRGINWKKIGMKNTLKVWLTVGEKLLENLLMRAEQMAIAMQLRGFTTPNEHQVEWEQLRIETADVLALAVLVGLWVVRIAWGNELP
jgi:energy-coupling factor transport system permease protein